MQRSSLGFPAHLGGDESVDAPAALFACVQIAEVLGKDLPLHGRPVPLLEDPLPGALQLEIPSGEAHVGARLGGRDSPAANFAGVVRGLAHGMTVQADDLSMGSRRRGQVRLELNRPAWEVS
jgi:hypothetical protein